MQISSGIHGAQDVDLEVKLVGISVIDDALRDVVQTLNDVDGCPQVGLERVLKPCQRCLELDKRFDPVDEVD